jgi:hypothetical protein
MIFDLKNIDFNLVNNLKIENFEEKEDSKKEDSKKDKLNKKSRKPNKNLLDYTKIMQNFENKVKTQVVLDKNKKKTRTTFNDYEIFDWEQYIKNNKDLNNLKNKEEAWFHWCDFGENEGRLFYEDKKKTKVYNLFEFNETNHNIKSVENNSKKNSNLYEIFDWMSYINIYPDLNHFKTKEEAWDHYIRHGKNENRIFTKILDASSDSETNSDDSISECDTLTDISLNNKAKSLNNLSENNTEEIKEFIEEDKLKLQAQVDMKPKIESQQILQPITEPEPILEPITEPEPILEPITKSEPILEPKNENFEEIEIKRLIQMKIQKNALKNKQKLNKFKDYGEHFQMNSNFIIKNEYQHYGNHFYGWKNVINQFVDYLKINQNKICFEKKIFLDEWLEKLLLWGNVNLKTIYVNELLTTDCMGITFIHNPPFVKWNNYPAVSELLKEIIYDDSLTNDNTIDLMNSKSLTSKFVYIYTLSIYHKEFLYKYYPSLRRKIVSVYHPIDLIKKDDETEFNIEEFNKNKNIVHIGWWLRNFKTFINEFKPPLGFTKSILIKNDFQTSWKSISQNYDISGIIVLSEINEKEYEKLFINNCIFVDLEDCTANNLILECIKFNTPIIIRKIPSVVEYLGNKYPFYFENNNDLLSLNDNNIFQEKILSSYNYLKNMCKNHIQLNTFNEKIYYDMEKLNVAGTNDKEKLTWFCFVKKIHLLENIKSFIEEFISQDENENISLKLVFTDTFYNDSECNIIKEIINQFINQNKNISYVIADEIIENKYNIFLDICIQNNRTKYMTIVNITDTFKKCFSNKFITFLEENPNADIAYSSYSIKISNSDLEEEVLFENNQLINYNKINTTSLSNTGMVWRKKIHNIIGTFKYYDDDNKKIYREFWRRCIYNNLNIICATEKKIYSIYE